MTGGIVTGGVVPGGVTGGTFTGGVAPGGVVGVIGVRMRHAEQLSIDTEELLETFISHIALAVERELLEETSRHAAVLAASERLYATVLDTVTPL